jgi:hypothetical protein
MNKENHIKELERVINDIKKEPAKGWIGGISKYFVIRKIERKIKSLKKDIGRNQK